LGDGASIPPKTAKSQLQAVNELLELPFSQSDPQKEMIAAVI
jgi:hypothetical protein